MTHPSVLFSPIGTSDPMTWLGDGAMLHIVRHYRPQHIVLALSPRLAAFEDEDSRYTAAIRSIAKADGPYSPEIDLLRLDIDEVHRYDAFLGEFRARLQHLRERFPEARLLVNATSGTPAMQHTLMTLATFMDNVVAVQVATPTRDLHRLVDRTDPDEFSVELLDENPDNEPGQPNRCQEVANAPAIALVQRETAKQFLGKLDFASALAVARTAGLDQPTLDALEFGYERSTLEWAHGERKPPKPFPNEPTSPFGEYVLMLDWLVHQQRWADFARALEPAVREGYFEIADRAGIQVERQGRGKKEVVRFNGGQGTYRSGRVSATAGAIKGFLTPLVKEPELRSDLDLLGEALQVIRNKAAHELRATTEDDVYLGHITPERVLRILGDLSGVQLGAYRRMATTLIELIDGAPLPQ